MSNNRRTVAMFILVLLVSGTAHTQDLPAEALRVISDALFLSPEYTVPVRTRSGEPVAVAADFNRDGRLDVAVLTVAADPRIETTEAALSANNRLFDTAAIRPLFLLETLFQPSNAIITTELGRQLVLDGLSVVRLSEQEHVAALVSFRSSRGTSDHLITFSRDGRAHRLRLAESPSEFGELADLDGDGTLEAVSARRVPEAGRGYETFLELHRLTDRGYARESGFAIVRGITSFFASISAHVLNADWTALAESVSGEPYGQELERLAATFELVEVNGEAPSQAARSTPPTQIQEFVTMQLTDNPFPEPFRGQTIRLTFRLECCEDQTRVYSAYLRMEENPFSGRRFAFLTEQEAEQ
jgi:hypothetical protein